MLIQVFPSAIMKLIQDAQSHGLTFTFEAQADGARLKLNLQSNDWNGPDPVIVIREIQGGNAEATFFLNNVMTPSGGV